MTGDKIILTGIEVFAWGGDKPAEKEIGQRYRVDVELEIDVARVAETDRLEETVDYGRVIGEVVRTLREKPFRLLETITDRVAANLLAEFAVASVKVRVAKLLPPVDAIVTSSAVEVTRTRTS